MKSLIFLIVLFLSIECFAKDIPTGNYTLRAGSISSTEKPAAPDTCDVVIDLQISEGNTVTLKNRYWGECTKPALDPSSRKFVVKQWSASEEGCYTKYWVPSWNPFYTNLVIHDFRSSSTNCSPTYGIGIEERDGSEPTLYSEYISWN